MEEVAPKLAEFIRVFVFSVRYEYVISFTKELQEI